MKEVKIRRLMLNQEKMTSLCPGGFQNEDGEKSDPIPRHRAIKEVTAAITEMSDGKIDDDGWD